MPGDLCANISDKGFLSTTTDIEVATGSTYGGNLIFAIEAQQVLWALTVSE